MMNAPVLLVIAWNVGGGLAGLIALTVFARWLVSVGNSRIGLAFIDSTRPAARAVADTEAALLPPGFDLGRKNSYRLPLSARLAAYRNEKTA